MSTLVTYIGNYATYLGSSAPAYAAWNRPERILNRKMNETVSTSASSTVDEFSTHIFDAWAAGDLSFLFNSFIISVQIRVRWEFIKENGNDEAHATLVDPLLSQGGGIFSFSPSNTDNGTLRANDGPQITTLNYTGSNVPDATLFGPGNPIGENDLDFACAFNYKSNGGDGGDLKTIKLYNVEFTVTYAIAGIQVTYTGNSISNNNGSRNIGTFVQNSTQSVNLVVQNNGDSPSTLYIYQNGITVTGKGNLSSNPVASAGFTIAKPGGASLNIPITVNTGTLGSNSISVTIVNNASFCSFTLVFTVSAADSLSPGIKLTYGASSITNGASVNLGNFGQSVNNDVTFSIGNTGSPTLVVANNGISVTSSGSGAQLTTNPVSSSSANVVTNATISFVIRLDSASLGHKTAVVVVSSNDTANSPFVFTLSYNISSAYNLLVKEDAMEVSENDIVNLGSFNKKATILKTISLSNNGITYNIRVLGITASGDLTIENIPALPFVLQTNEANVSQLTAKLSSAVLGNRTGGITVQWEPIN